VGGSCIADNPSWDRTVEEGTFSLCVKDQGEALRCRSKEEMGAGDSGNPRTEQDVS